MFRLALSPVPRRLAVLFVGAVTVLTSALHAQHVVAVEYEGKTGVVRRLQNHPPFVEIDGKWVRCTDAQFALVAAKEYLPVTVKIEHRRFQRGAKAISDNGTARGHKRNSGRFVLTADLRSPEQLDNVVLVLELGGTGKDASLFLENIGHLDANVSHHVSIDEKTEVRLFGMGLKALHVFSNGAETRIDDDGAKDAAPESSAGGHEVDPTAAGAPR